MFVFAATPWWYWLGWFVLALTGLVLVVLAVEARRKVGVLRRQMEAVHDRLDRVEATT